MSDASPLVEQAPPPEAPRVLSMPVEAIMDSHRLRGELHAGNVPRRLVDILNSVDGGYLTVNSSQLDDPLRPGDSPRGLEIVQLRRDAILFIMPRGGPQPSDPFEVVKKVVAHATIVVPGFAVTGNIYLMPNADPATVPMIGTHHFIPVTDATVMAGYGRVEVWQEPVVLVNLTRAMLYGPSKV